LGATPFGVGSLALNVAPGCQWMPMDANGCQWMPMDANGCQWMPMDANGCQWMLLWRDRLKKQVTG